MNYLKTISASGLLSLLAAALLTACGDTAKYPIEDGIGPDPVLPAPVERLIPTVKLIPARPWSDNAQPVPAPELEVRAFARHLNHPRWLYVLPNGDVLVAETNSPARRQDTSLRGRMTTMAMHKTGAGMPSPDRITLLRDADGDGIAEIRSQFLAGLYSPFGMALVNERFYVANADSLVSFPYRHGDTQITAAPKRVANLPGGINHHWTKSLLASTDGHKLYVGVGANSNIAENGIAAELNRAAILQIDPGSGATRVFANGLRNPVGMAWEPSSGVLWTVVNERDGLGSDLVPDYLTSVREGGFYGWPYSYFGQHVDTRVQLQDPRMVAHAIKPDYALGAHTGSLGLTFSGGELLPSNLRNGAFIGQHGSWNRSPPSGYKVIFIPFADGRPQGKPITVLDGFLTEDEHAQGRPVGLALDANGALLVADDTGNTIWRLTPRHSTQLITSQPRPAPRSRLGR